jgi:hypothetical protein
MRNGSRNGFTGFFLAEVDRHIPTPGYDGAVMNAIARPGARSLSG